VLPAGYVPKHGLLPSRHVIERYGPGPPDDDLALDDSMQANPSKPSGSSDRSQEPRARGAGAKGPKPPVNKAWAAKIPPVDGKAFTDGVMQDVKPPGARQNGIGAWTKAARRNSGFRGKLKGAEYLKAPVPNWLRDMPEKLKKSDIIAALKKEMPERLKKSELLAALKSSDKGDVKYFNNQEAVQSDEIYR
jgi:hypothetical protein